MNEQTTQWQGDYIAKILFGQNQKFNFILIDDSFNRKNIHNIIFVIQLWLETYDGDANYRNFCEQIDNEQTYLHIKEMCEILYELIVREPVIESMPFQAAAEKLQERYMGYLNRFFLPYK